MLLLMRSAGTAPPAAWPVETPAPAGRRSGNPPPVAAAGSGGATSTQRGSRPRECALSQSPAKCAQAGHADDSCPQPVDNSVGGRVGDGGQRGDAPVNGGGRTARRPEPIFPSI